MNFSLAVAHYQTQSTPKWWKIEWNRLTIIVINLYQKEPQITTPPTEIDLLKFFTRNKKNKLNFNDHHCEDSCVCVGWEWICEIHNRRVDILFYSQIAAQTKLKKKSFNKKKRRRIFFKYSSFGPNWSNTTPATWQSMSAIICVINHIQIILPEIKKNLLNMKN